MQHRYRKVTGPESIQGTPEWLVFREGKIGASDAPTIMGENPWESRLQFFHRTIAGKSKEKSQAMEKGTRLEPVARKWLNDKIGTNYQPEVVQSTIYPDFIASLDGYFEDEEGTPHICEIKCAGRTTHDIAVAGRVPKQYRAQLQHQMDLVGVDRMLYVSFYDGDGVILEVERDEYYCVDLFATELSFLASLLSFVPPEDKSEWVIQDDPMNLSSRYKLLEDQINELTDEQEKLKEEIIEQCKNSKTILGNLKIQKVHNSGRYNYKKFIEDQKLEIPVGYKSSPTESVRFTSF